MSIETFSEWNNNSTPTPPPQEDIPTVEMPVVEFTPDLRSGYDFNGEPIPGYSPHHVPFLKTWWRRVSAYLFGHLLLLLV